MKIQILLVTLLATSIVAQYPGHGISKTTYAATEPIQCWSWFQKYLPCSTAPDECNNNQCTCGEQGRVYLTMDNNNQQNQQGQHQRKHHRKLQPGPSPGNGFGVHTVNAWGKNHARGATTGKYSVKDIEEQFTTKFADLTVMDPFLDYNFAVFTTDLESYINTFKNDNIAYRAINWGFQEDQYTSILVQVETSQMIIEFIGTRTSMLSADEVTTTDEVRVYGTLTCTSGILCPLQVSRAATDLDAITSFYSNVFGSSVHFQQTLEDGSKLATFLVGELATVQLKFVVRTASVSSGTISVKDFEDALNDTHKQYMTSYNSCWDLWGDNHYAVDDRSIVIDNFVSYLEQNNIPYHVGGGMGMYHIYMPDPTGWQIQVDGRYNNPPSGTAGHAEGLCTTSCQNTVFKEFLSIE